MKGKDMNVGGTRAPFVRAVWRRGSVSLAALVVVVSGVAACAGGASHSPAIPSAGGTSTASPSAGSGAQAGGLLAYASCMRSHGVPNFPDPTGSGGFNDKRAVVSALQAVSNAQADAAQTACQNLLPAGGLSGQANPTITAQEQQDYLNAAACMRSHGITNFPDPTFSDGHVSLSIPSSINTNSTQFTQTAQICTKLIPAGLPYSRPGG